MPLSHPGRAVGSSPCALGLGAGHPGSDKGAWPLAQGCYLLTWSLQVRAVVAAEAAALMFSQVLEMKSEFVV